MYTPFKSQYSLGGSKHVLAFISAVNIEGFIDLNDNDYARIAGLTTDFRWNRWVKITNFWHLFLQLRNLLKSSLANQHG